MLPSAEQPKFLFYLFISTLIYVGLTDNLLQNNNKSKNIQKQSLRHVSVKLLPCTEIFSQSPGKIPAKKSPEKSSSDFHVRDKQLR